jgi:RNA polymerase sigma factor (TIGR02999 family)
MRRMPSTPPRPTSSPPAPGASPAEVDTAADATGRRTVADREDAVPVVSRAEATEVGRLIAAAASDATALGDLMPLVYDDLKRIAAGHLRRERGNLTLQTTALVHEAWIELARQRQRRWSGREHFFALVSQFMKRILQMRGRARQTAKRGGAVRPETLPDELPMAAAFHGPNLLALALAELEAIDPFKANLVRLRAEHGLTVPECAAQLGVSPATIDRHWALARAWLYDALAP